MRDPEVLRALGGIHPGTYLFVYACALVLGLAFGVAAWLTRPAR